MAKQKRKQKFEFTFIDVELLSKYLDDQNRILPRRITELSIKNQVKLSKAVKRARIFGLLSFVVQAHY
jgi:small subunit ribosomal protein S18